MRDQPRGKTHLMLDCYSNFWLADSPCTGTKSECPSDLVCPRLSGLRGELGGLRTAGAAADHGGHGFQSQAASKQQVDETSRDLHAEAC